ncbi:hypothetical protein A3715_15360 [Oleiphilus sp. HI0009]|nr:hypothetical protein A3715_15360 [Oleiphilus sp. HI0009]
MVNMFNKYVELLYKWRYEVIATILLLSAIGINSAVNIETDTSPYFLPNDYPSRQLTSEMNDYFVRTNDSIIASITFKESAFETSSINLLEQAHKELEMVSSDIISIKSILNSDNIIGTDDEIIIEPTYKSSTIPSSQANILENQLLSPLLISKDGKTINIFIELGISTDDINGCKEAVSAVKQYFNSIEKTNNSVSKISLAGIPVMNSAVSKIVEEDNKKYSPLVLTIITLLLVTLFKSFRASFYIIILASCTISITMLVMSLLSIKMNIVTTILPVFLISISVTDGIHLLSKINKRKEIKSALSKALETLWRPMLVTSLTTGIGFLSLANTELTNLESFGIMVTVGIFIALILTYTLLPIMLLIGPIKQQKRKHKTRSINYKFINRYSAYLAFPTIIIIIVLGLPNTKLDHHTISSFHSENPIRQDSEYMAKKGLGSIPLNIWIKNENEDVITPEIMRAIREIQRYANKTENIINNFSVLDYFQVLHEQMNTNEELDLNNTNLLKQYLVLLEGGYERDIETVLEIGSYKNTRINLALLDDSSNTTEKIIEDIKNILRSHNVEDYSFTGYGMVTVDAANEVLKSQLTSVLQTFTIITIMLSILYRSISDALLAILPMTVCITSIFGLMGLTGMNIDIGTCVVASIAFGIGIDYSIHFIESYRRTLDIDKAIEDIINPICISALVLGAGFSVQMLSGFMPIQKLGLLICISVFGSAFLVMTILPKLKSIKK